MGILATRARIEVLDLHQESGTVLELDDKARVYILNNTRRRFVINERRPRVMGRIAPMRYGGGSPRIPSATLLAGVPAPLERLT